MSYIINVQNLEKSFNDKKVLKGVNISVNEKEIFGLLGPSGAGKTTIIKILTGQLKRDGGNAEIFSTDCNSIDHTVYEKTGMVLDEHGLYTRLSCYDNLCVFTDIYGIDKKRIFEVLAKVGLGDAAKKQVSKLSKGMMQRLVIARSILNDPKLLFLDEPTSGLDPATAQEIHKMIFELRDNGATVFLTTHNMEEAAKLCDNVALLNEGNIVEYGTPQNLCLKYNKEKRVKILTKSGKELSFPCDESAASKISECFASSDVQSIHSSEPDLETVFIALTGRSLL